MRKILTEQAVKELLEQGMNNRQIADRLGVSPPSVSVFIKRHGLRLKEEIKDGQDCVKCTPEVVRSCRYGVKLSNLFVCDYIGVHNKRRPCSPDSCTVYERKRGKRDKYI